MVLCFIPLRGKQEYQVINIGMKSTLSRLLLQGIPEFEMNGNQRKTPEKNLKAVLTNSNLL